MKKKQPGFQVKPAPKSEWVTRVHVHYFTRDPATQRMVYRKGHCLTKRTPPDYVMAAIRGLPEEEEP